MASDHSLLQQRWTYICCIICVLIVGCRPTESALLFPNSDFEEKQLVNWSASGDGNAFNSQPVFGDNVAARSRGHANQQGCCWIGTYDLRPSDAVPAGGIQWDGPRGTLRSIPFSIIGKRISFLIGGGQGSELTGVGLEVEGKLVLFEPGRGSYVNDESLHRVQWDVSEWLGKKAVIVIRDDASDGWGHINADDFRYDHSWL